MPSEHGGRDLNSQLQVLETCALPIELPPCKSDLGNLGHRRDGGGEGSPGRNFRLIPVALAPGE